MIERLHTLDWGKVHIVEIYPTKASCICGYSKNSSPSKSSQVAAFDHAKQHFPAQVRDMRKKPYKTVEIGDPKDKPKQGELFLR